LSAPRFTSARAPLPAAIATTATPTTSAHRTPRRTFYPQNYGCCMAIISGKNEGLVNAEWMERGKTSSRMSTKKIG
jgi:hypothetical protein